MQGQVSATNNQRLLKVWTLLYLLFGRLSIGKENELNQDGTAIYEAIDLTNSASKLAQRLLYEIPNLLSEKDAVD